MMLESPKNSRRVLTFLVLVVASLVGLLLLPPIHQDQNYHDFADQRTILGTAFLERRFKSSIHCRWSCGGGAVPPRRGNRLAFPGHTNDRLRFGLLSP
jgi:hypothetical protein